MTSWRVIQGDALEQLRLLPDRSVQTCITSPPYFGLRDYGEPGQLGLEPTPDEYVARLVEVFREVRRVLRDDGTLWLNLGDSYAAVNRGESATPRADEKYAPQMQGTHFHADLPTDRRRIEGQKRAGIKPKDLLGIPWLVAFALRADGWYLRSDIIWAKPNPMPESVTDRPTKAHEYVFLLSKGPRYFYDSEAIREEMAPESEARYNYAFGGAKNEALAEANEDGIGVRTRPIGDREVTAGRNKRSVWTVPTQPFPGAHFAVFPPKLIEPCVLAGSAETACGVCGAPWERVVERETEYDGKAVDGYGAEAHWNLQGAQGRGPKKNFGGGQSLTLDWQPTCFCGCVCGHTAETHTEGICMVPECPCIRFEPDSTGASTVLDPFAGAGTTGLVAIRHNRSFIGIELNPEYAEMARQRIRDDAPLMNYVSEDAA